MKSIARIVCGFIALLVAAPAFAGSSQGWVYWAELESNTVKRSHLDGSNVEVLYSTLDGVSSPAGLAIDPDTDQLYWSQSQFFSIEGGIKQGNLDGTITPVTIVTALSPLYPEQFSKIAADFNSGVIYWITSCTCAGNIYKANLDGSRIEEIPVGGQSQSLAIDEEAGKLYWGIADGLGCSPAKIQRGNLDGTGIEDVVMGLKYVTAIAVDHDAGKIYWSEHQDCGVNAIKRRDLAGGAVETLVPESARGIALDLVAGKMYWTRSGGVIRWANLDGTQAADLISVGLQLPLSIAVLPQSGSPADLNEDGIVNGIDLAILLGAWGACPPRGGCDADLAPPPGGGGGDGVVNGFDLALLLGSWS